MVAENTLLLLDFIDYAISSLTAIGAIAVAASYGAIAAVGPKTGPLRLFCPTTSMFSRTSAAAGGSTAACQFRVQFRRGHRN